MYDETNTSIIVLRTLEDVHLLDESGEVIAAMMIVNGRYSFTHSDVISDIAAQALIYAHMYHMIADLRSRLGE